MSSKGILPTLPPSSHAYTQRNLSSAIREYDAKLLLAYWLERAPAVDPNIKLATSFVFPAPKVAQVSWDPETNAITADTQLPGWVSNTKLVAKPDQLIKRRGKAGLLALNKSWDEAKEWIRARAGKPQKVSRTSRHLITCRGWDKAETSRSCDAYHPVGVRFWAVLSCSIF